MDDERDLPPVSRLGRTSTRAYRGLSRTRERHRRQRTRLRIDELLGQVIKSHGLTDDVRQHAVFLYWKEIAGERFAARTFPASFAEGVLHVSATSSSWVHEMQFYKTQLVDKINTWIGSQSVWLGEPPLVTDMRFVLGSQRREPLVDPAYVDRLRSRLLRKLRPRPIAPPPTVTDEQRAAIEAETSCIVDDELRATIERVRTRWNR